MTDDTTTPRPLPRLPRSLQRPRASAVTIRLPQSQRYLILTRGNQLSVPISVWSAMRQLDRLLVVIWLDSQASDQTAPRVLTDRRCQRILGRKGRWIVHVSDNSEATA